MLMNTLLLIIFLTPTASVIGHDVVSLSFYTSVGSEATNDANLQVGDSTNLLLIASSLLDDNITVDLTFEEDSSDKNHTDKMSVDVSQPITRNNKTLFNVTAVGKNAGHVTLVLKALYGEDNSTELNISQAFVRFQVFKSQPLNIVSEVIGWIYFAAWSISFYPQVYLNWKRKSVVGLNFDFVGMNLAGFVCYSAYNVGLFWIGGVQDEFRDKNPHDIIPVELNDVIFALHAVLLTSVTIVQIAIYERGGQRMSITARVILSLCALAIIVIVIVAAVPSVSTFKWLEMVMALSYIKLGITIIKYIPQVWMNFRRKSTVGWSIGNVLLDFSGGTCSIIQMIILAYNFNDWASIFLNPVKFWLGALSIIFDIIFMVQHYCLYRNRGADYVIQANESDK